jgi:hypothetical protein
MLAPSSPHQGCFQPDTIFSFLIEPKLRVQPDSIEQFDTSDSDRTQQASARRTACKTLWPPVTAISSFVDLVPDAPSRRDGAPASRSIIRFLGRQPCMPHGDKHGTRKRAPTGNETAEAPRKRDVEQIPIESSSADISQPACLSNCLMSIAAAFSSFALGFQRGAFQVITSLRLD